MKRKALAAETVLVVEKSRRVVDRLCRELAQAGHRAVGATTYPEAEKLLVEASPGIVLCAAKLPSGSGFEFVRRVKTRNPPVVCMILVREERDDTATRAAEAGADNFLVLPLKGTELLATVRAGSQVRLLRRHLLAASRPKVPPNNGLFAPDTGFYTFEHFRQILFIEVKRALRYKYPLSVVMITCDPLEAPKGVKREDIQHLLHGGLAVAIRKSIRDIDIPVYYKGENVLVVMPHTDRKGAMVVARRIQEKVRNSTLKIGGHALQPTISIGLGAAQDLKAESFAEVIKVASRNLEEARKARGQLKPEA